MAFEAWEGVLPRQLQVTPVLPDRNVLGQP